MTCIRVNGVSAKRRRVFPILSDPNNLVAASIAYTPAAKKERAGGIRDTLRREKSRSGEYRR